MKNKNCQIVWTFSKSNKKCRKRQNRYDWHRNTRALTFLPWPFCVIYHHLRIAFLTTSVHFGMQYPFNENKLCLGGIAILLVYSSPSSIMAESYFLSFWVTYKRIPDESTIPETNSINPYNYFINFSWQEKFVKHQSIY